MARRLAAPSVEVLRRLYCSEEMTIAEIALVFDVAPQTVANWLRRGEVPTRPSPVSRRVDIDDDVVVSRYADGETAAEIAGGLGCSLGLVYSRLERLGIKRRPPKPRPLPTPSEPDLRRLYCDSRSTVSQLAQQFEVTEHVVYGWLRSAGIPLRGRDTRDRIDVEQLVRRYEAGASGPELARVYGCSVATIYRRLEDGGVARRWPSPVIGRDALVDALDRGWSALRIAGEYGISVTAVCRALDREGLHTVRQAERGRAAVGYAALLAAAERDGTADQVTLTWLRQRASGRAPEMDFVSQAVRTG